MRAQYGLMGANDCKCNRDQRGNGLTCPPKHGTVCGVCLYLDVIGYVFYTYVLYIVCTSAVHMLKLESTEYWPNRGELEK
jgi:hypothetical protein